MSEGPTQRTLKRLRDEGWTVEKTEHQISFPGMKFPRKKDLFGFIDILAVNDHGQTLAIQATSGANTSARAKKIRGECAEAFERVLKAGWVVEVWGWRKLKGHGNRQWFPKIQRLKSLEESSDEYSEQGGL